MKRNVDFFRNCKKNGEKFSVLTAYDYPTAKLVEEAGIDMIILGDSVGTNVLGYANETEVTLDDMLHHSKAVRRGTQDTFLVVDLPYGTYRSTDAAVLNAKKLIDAGADAIKFEGINIDVLRAIKKELIPVVCHIGLNPQHEQDKMRSGKISKGKTLSEATELIAGAMRLSEEGADLLVVEKVPLLVSKLITENISIPTIGIGSGSYCDGQVLIIYDLLNISEKRYKHVPKYIDVKKEIIDTMKIYEHEIKNGIFPAVEHSNKIDPSEYEQVEKWCKEHSLKI